MRRISQLMVEEITVRIEQDLLDHAHARIELIDEEWRLRLARLGFRDDLRALLDAAFRDATRARDGS